MAQYELPIEEVINDLGKDINKIVYDNILRQITELNKPIIEKLAQEIYDTLHANIKYTKSYRVETDCINYDISIIINEKEIT